MNDLFNYIVKPVMLLLATLTTLGALLVLGHTLFSPEGSFLWIIGKIVISTGVIGTGMLTWLHYGSPRPTGFMNRLLLLGAAALMVCGAAGAVWGLHMGQTTGDYEYWAVMINLMMVAQGGLTVWNLYEFSILSSEN